MTSQRSYFMRDQARAKVQGIMDERWLTGPVGALWTLLAFVSAFTILGGIDAAHADVSLAFLGDMLR